MKVGALVLTAMLVIGVAIAVAPTAAACDATDIQCIEGCWEPGSDACVRACVIGTCKRIELGP